MKRKFVWLLSIPLLALMSFSAFAGGAPTNLHLTDSPIGYAALLVFAFAYSLVMMEEFIHLRKSKPVILTAGFIWGLVAWKCQKLGLTHTAEGAVRHNILEFAELFLFLLVAMTYVNAMEERNVFECLRAWLVNKGFSLRQLFWITGVMSFFISPIADNLTTALLMCAVVMAVGGDNRKFILIACINIVVAANAGGAFSPFGDITTLMVWQKGIISIQGFLVLFFPSVISYIIPAVIMSFAISNDKPDAQNEVVELKPGAIGVTLLFLCAIATAISFHNFLHLPPAVGMMTGLAYLQFFGYYLKLFASKKFENQKAWDLAAFDIFKKIQRAEWDTLLFFYGVVLCVGGLAVMGYLALVSDVMYLQWGSTLPEGFQQTPANALVGVLSAIIDNIPVMFAVLTMHPTMSEGQWLLVTLTAGVGGSMLSVGSAAGVALMGQARGMYTFFGHLKWSWAIAIGYVAGIAAHLWINYDSFSVPLKHLTH